LQKEVFMRTIALLLIGIFLCVNWSCKKDLSGGKSELLTQIESLDAFETAISSGVSLMFFHAQWCTLCKSQRPMVEEASSNPQMINVLFGEVDYENVKSVVEKYNIEGFPTMVIFKDGAEVGRIRGSNNSPQSIVDRILPFIN
jgi:thioredoxin 1